MESFSSEQRSLNMQAVKSSGSKEERLLMRTLYHRNHRYRKNNKKVFGKPDLTFKKHKLAIFVDSEFFHGKDFETKKKPVNNAEFWEKKIKRNIERDKEVNEELAKQGWTVLRFWSNDIKKNLDHVVETIEKHLPAKNTTVKLTWYPELSHETITIAAEPDKKQ
ncbi:very short patch repair endonuclease [Flavobacterium silvaticum]|uniref:Very short patch repair endonuclease n=1 Tax=Flavobacterium silvaticum TaxID=1852020 RepID=A0A972FQF6_9FLAO|nr:very short patch repair endonuclease [Flavobacterium silvaticum]NMH26573.1 very short patch repair endonuclease [Flavobacterium silvaticum]